MYISSMYFTIASIASMAVVASPLDLVAAGDAMVPGYVELSREAAVDGTLIYYGYPEGNQPSLAVAPTGAGLAAPCFNGDDPALVPSCSGSHGARYDNCKELVSNLYNDPGARIGTSPRQLCFQGVEGNNAFCCVSWHNVVDPLYKSDLAAAADKILNTCSTSGVSGWFDKVNLHDNCSKMCLSNRGTGC